MSNKKPLYFWLAILINVIPVILFLYYAFQFFGFIAVFTIISGSEKGILGFQKLTLYLLLGLLIGVVSIIFSKDRTNRGKISAAISIANGIILTLAVLNYFYFGKPIL